MQHTLRLMLFAFYFSILAIASPALGDTVEDIDPPLATPKPVTNTQSAIALAEQRIRRYLDSIPEMPKDVVVVPATGLVPWPLTPLERDVRAEVWSVLPRYRGSLAGPIMLFAVRTDTGEVQALYFHDLKSNPRYQ